MGQKRIAVVAGDGIGKEVMPEGLRSLEAVAQLHGGQLRPHTGPVNLVIQPGYRFAVVQGLLTNFHLPKSTLMMLVSAFAGYYQVMALYRHAIAERYRFFSYGDAMLLA